MIAVKLFKDGKLSTGQAAESVGVSKRTFIELLGEYNVSVFGYNDEELEEDLEKVEFHISKSCVYRNLILNFLNS
ncbi:UPF0175 family protein [Cyclobacterium plantarum]|uniref:UPF0175 family protein n=1 Tax=Cyclobacterium plantarum TaxID=2716263 RepID=UPI001C9E5E6C|nr:UPF0175 family protein [Cyclobacterium plantarum]